MDRRNFPAKKNLRPTILSRLFFWSSNYSLIWLTSSLIAFLAIVVAISYIFVKRLLANQTHPSKQPLRAPSSNLSSPALAILEKRGSTHRVFAAGILYLAATGYLKIIKKDGQFYLVRQMKPPDYLRLDQKIYNLFLGSWFLWSKKEIGIKRNMDIFNLAVKDVYESLYQEIKDHHLFVADIWQTIHLNRAVGILLSTTSSIFFVISLRILPYPPFASLTWLLLLFSSLLMIKLAQSAPVLSQKGQSERNEWHAFKRFLSEEKPVEKLDLSMDIYLHYAVALSCEKKWIKRFSNSHYQVPVWFIGQSTNTDEIAAEITDFVLEISSALQDSAPPEIK